MLFAEQYVPVRRYVQRRGGGSDVDDVVADTFLVAWRRLDAMPDDALPWLLGVARNILRNRDRAQRRGAMLERRIAAGRSYSPEPADLGGERLAVAFARLSRTDQELLALVAWDGLAPHRAAAVLGCTQAALRVRLHRARRRLEAHIEQLEGEAPPVAGTRLIREEGQA